MSPELTGYDSNDSSAPLRSSGDCSTADKPSLFYEKNISPVSNHGDQSSF